MSIQEKISRLFNTADQKSASYNLYEVSQTESELQRVSQFQKLFDYYIGDNAKMQAYLQRALSKTFDATDIEEMQTPTFNITQRIINRTSIAYSIPAERYIVLDETDRTKKQALLYSDIIYNSNINAAVKRAHRYAKLMDCSHVSPVWRNDRIEYDVFPSHLLTVLESQDDYLKPQAVMYRIAKINDSGNEYFEYVYWDEEVNAILDKDGGKVKEIPNPYKLIPFIPMRLRETENYWGEGDTQLVDINEKINILLVSLFDNAIMQSHGQPFAINLGSKGTLQTGPRHVIEAENVRSDQVQPSFQFVQPQAAIDEVTKLIDWMIKTVCMQRGLPAFSVSTENKAQSGAAKAIDILELQEIRQDDIENLKDFEYQLYEATRAVWNHHAKEKLDESAKFAVEFEDLTPEPPEKDQLLNKKMKLELGLWTPVEELTDEDSGVTKEDAMKMVEENLSIRNKLNDEFGIMKSLSEPQQVQNGNI
jgi:hypothetical protein